MRTQSMYALLLAAILSLGATFAAEAAGSRQADAKPDPAAYALLKEAHDNRDTFPAGFTGLTADLVLNDNGKEAKGTLTVSASGDPKLAIADATTDEKKWAEEEIGSAMMHRIHGDFAHGDGAHPLSFVADDHSPLGRLISLNDRFKSTYRVKDGQITEVTRTMGNIRFTITMLENKTVDGGKYLPSYFIVTYFDATSGAIKSVDAFSDAFERVRSIWIPSARRVVTAENGNFTTRSFALSNIHLSGAAAAAR